MLQLYGDNPLSNGSIENFTDDKEIECNENLFSNRFISPESKFNINPDNNLDQKVPTLQFPYCTSLPVCPITKLNIYHSKNFEKKINNTELSSDPFKVLDHQKICFSSENSENYKKALLNENYKIGIDSIPIQQDKLINKKGGHFTMMLAGQSGLGKTSFVNTLFGGEIIPYWEKVESKFGTPSYKTTEIIRHCIKLEENGLCLDLTIIDTPGFGNDIDSSFAWVPIVNYIDGQLRSYVYQEEQPIRSNLSDYRIHCCLYFLPPSNKVPSALDIESMKEISKRVNLIPIIAKSDGLSPIEIKNFKKLVRKVLEDQKIKICAFMDERTDELLLDLPYALVCSEGKVKNDKGNMVRGREYKWGIVEIENLNHSEFVLLKNMIMSDHLVDLIIGTEVYYETCRSHILQTRINLAKELLNEKETQSDQLNVDYLSALDNYKYYQKYDKKCMDSLIIEWSPDFVHKQWECKKRFNTIVKNEEIKFRNWKKALMEKQSECNKEIDQIHNHVKMIQEQCERLESLILTKNTST